MEYKTRSDLADLWVAALASRKCFSVNEILHLSTQGQAYLRERSRAEELVWVEFRSSGMPLALRFMPEFRVEKYFIDFADPFMKIGLEIDGAEWHTDHEADLQRQLEIEAQGWRLLRVPAVTAWREYSKCHLEYFGESEDSAAVTLGERYDRVGDADGMRREYKAFYAAYRHVELTCFMRWLEDEYYRDVSLPRVIDPATPISIHRPGSHEEFIASLKGETDEFTW